MKQMFKLRGYLIKIHQTSAWYLTRASLYRIAVINEETNPSRIYNWLWKDSCHLQPFDDTCTTFYDGRVWIWTSHERVAVEFCHPQNFGMTKKPGIIFSIQKFIEIRKTM